MLAHTWEKLSDAQKANAQFEFVSRQAIYILGKMRTVGPTKRSTSYRVRGVYRYQVRFEEPIARTNFDLQLNKLSKFVHQNISKGQFTLERNLAFILDATALLSSDPTNFVETGLMNVPDYRRVKDQLIVGVTAPLEMSDFNKMLGRQLVPVGVIFELMKYDGSDDLQTPRAFARNDLSHGERALPISGNKSWQKCLFSLRLSDRPYGFEFHTALFYLSHEQDSQFAQRFANMALSATNEKQFNNAFLEFLKASDGGDWLGARLSRPDDMGMEMPEGFSAVDVVRKGYAELYRSFSEFHGWKPSASVYDAALKMNVRTRFPNPLN